ncbi:MAG: class I SAM-dependent methyltransferase [Nitrospiraceae bacterium]
MTEPVQPVRMVFNDRADSISCPCGSVLPSREVFRTPTRKYWRCPSCDLMFLSPRPTAHSIREFYRNSYTQVYGQLESSPDRSPVYSSVLRHLSRHRAPPGRLLDIGCGDGRFLALCREAGWTCYGVELSREASEQAARRGITMLPNDWLNLSPSPKEAADRYDAITLINVLETVPDPVAVLRRVRQTLAPDGLVLIRVSNGAFHVPLRRTARRVGLQFQQAFHLFVYTPSAVQALFQSVGLESISVRNSRSSLAPIYASARLARRLAWRAAGTGLWMGAQVLYWLSGRRVVLAPSFEAAARPQES